MPQLLLPLIPDGASAINSLVSVVQENQVCTYFVGNWPIGSHDKEDRRAFPLMMAQLVHHGNCKQAEIIRAFRVSKNWIGRAVGLLETEGIEGFYKPRNVRGPAVLTAEVVTAAQQLLDAGHRPQDVAKKMGLKYDTLRKAIKAGRLRKPILIAQSTTSESTLPAISGTGAELATPASAESLEAGPHATEPASAAQIQTQELSEPVMVDMAPSTPVPPVRTLSRTASDKSQRTAQDAEAEMGTACTRPVERVMAALGLLDGVAPKFQECHDVSFGGVLCALPALLENGLLRRVQECLNGIHGYYTTTQILILLAYMALTRIKTVERLQYESPGELGKLMGLDRVPEVRCLRKKLKQLSADDAAQKWSNVLSRDWMQANPELAGTLYVDGHVRLYHGSQTQLPKRYVSRQRLCLRGTTAYWVNDRQGRPFFAVERPIDHGMLEALRTDIVPRLLLDVPGQPSSEELSTHRYRCRFTLIFDREGYSPEFFKEMWTKHRIACTSYHKHPKTDWASSEFTPTEIQLANGEVVTYQLAERGSWVGGAKNGMWMREVRKLNANGHQTSLLSSDFENEAPQDAGQLFSRWSQENFFRYSMEHLGIDLLADHSTAEIPDSSKPVVNPAWRELDRQSRSLTSQLTRLQSRFAALTLHPESEPKQVKQWETKKADLKEEIDQLEKKVADVKQLKGTTKRHLPWKELPEEHKFRCLDPSRKRLIDTVKMIAYRAETAMTQIVRESLARTDDARALLRDLYRSEADIVPRPEQGILEIRIHAMANPRSNRAIQHLLNQLNDAAITYPGTNLQLKFTSAAPPYTPENRN